jgi:hypothetical protein
VSAAGFEDLMKACGPVAGSSILVLGGSTKGGNVLVQIQAP